MKFRGPYDDLNPSDYFFVGKTLVLVARDQPWREFCLSTTFEQMSYHSATFGVGQMCLHTPSVTVDRYQL